MSNSGHCLHVSSTAFATEACCMSCCLVKTLMFRWWSLLVCSSTLTIAFVPEQEVDDSVMIHIDSMISRQSRMGEMHRNPSYRHGSQIFLLDFGAHALGTLISGSAWTRVLSMQKVSV